MQGHCHVTPVRSQVGGLLARGRIAFSDLAKRSRTLSPTRAPGGRSQWHNPDPGHAMDHCEHRGVLPPHEGEVELRCLAAPTALLHQRGEAGQRHRPRHLRLQLRQRGRRLRLSQRAKRHIERCL